MYCFSACHVLLYMILYQQTSVVYLQSLTLTIETSPLICGAEVTLKCLYSGPTCCTDDARVWTRDGTEIMNNGAPLIITKYKEERNDASFHFDMKILNLEESDFSKAFQCQYFFQTSNTVTLTQDSTYECLEPQSCPIYYMKGGDVIIIKGTLNINKAAPSPLVHAFYGNDNLTADFSNIVGPTNYDTWYYNLSMKIYKPIDCYYRRSDRFTLIAYIGTSRKQICESDMCECNKCGRDCWLYSIIPPSISVVIFLAIHCIVCWTLHCGKEEEKRREKNKEEGNSTTLDEKETCCSSRQATSAADSSAVTRCSGMCPILALMFFGFANFINMYATLPIGIYICPCNEGMFQWANICWACLTCHMAIFAIHLIFIKFDWNYIRKNCKIFLLLAIVFAGLPLLILTILDRKSCKGFRDCSLKKSLRYTGLVVLLLLILPIPFMIIYFCCLKGDSCWQKLLRYTGLVVLIILIFPIPFMIIYFWCLKDKNHMKEGERAPDANSGIEIRKDGKLVRDATTELL